MAEQADKAKEFEKQAVVPADEDADDEYYDEEDDAEGYEDDDEDDDEYYDDDEEYDGEIDQEALKQQLSNISQQDFSTALSAAMGGGGLSGLLNVLGGGLGGAEAAMLRGQAFQLEGEFEEAAQAYLDVIEQDPNHYKAHVALGQVLMFMDKPEEAVNFLLKATELDPNDANGYLYLGYSFHALGELDPAVQAFEQAIELEPDQHVARNNLGYIYFLKGDLESAGQAFIKAGDFGSERAYYNLGMVRLISGKEDAGWDAYDEAEELDPNYTQVEDHIEDLQKAVERYPEAALLLNQAVARLSAHVQK
jgi:tetratricopeptide (TPR) repeat protein